MERKIFIILAVFCTLVAQCFSRAPFQLKRSRFCGNDLVEALALVCNKHYNSPSMKKSIYYNQHLNGNSDSDVSDDYSQNALPYVHLFALDRIFEDDTYQSIASDTFYTT